MELTFVGKKQITGHVFTFYFKPPSPVSWQAGQFMIYFLQHKNSDVRGIMRFFTISSAPFEKNLAITTRISKKDGSSFKTELFNMRPGDKIKAKGPDGNFIVKDLGKNHVFIAGGIGITPFRSILTAINNQKKTMNYEPGTNKIVLLYANKNIDSIPFKKELDEILKSLPNLKIEYILSPNHIDKKVLKPFAKKIKNSVFYVSGPDPMVESTVNILESLRVPRKNIKEDYFSGYKKV